jgi:hypothetical protein
MAIQTCTSPTYLMIEAIPLPQHRFEHKSIGLLNCTKSSKQSLFQQPADM